MKQIAAGVYQHYKGKFYYVFGTRRHSETDEVLVEYIPLYIIRDNRRRIITAPTLRPLKMFTEVIQVEAPTGRRIRRFTKVG